MEEDGEEFMKWYTFITKVEEEEKDLLQRYIVKRFGVCITKPESD